MFSEYSHPQVKSVDHRIRINHFIGSGIIILFIFVTCLSQAVASSRSAYQYQNSEIKRAHVQTVGYHQPWLERFSGIAEDAFNEEHYQLARRVWVALAQQGHAEAAYKLGMMYDMGLGMERDAAVAAQWYRRAAENGNIHAQHNLAVAYANGDGVEMNINGALHWWQIAAASGNADSQYNLGIVFAMGVHGVQKNIDKAKKWWRKAAIEGDPMAQYNLRWWEKSALKGVQQASWALEIIKTRHDYLACWE